MAQVDYATVAEVKAEIEKEHAGDDTEIGLLISAASRLIDNHCRRPDGFVADTEESARDFAGSGDTIQWIDENIEVTKVKVKESVTDDFDSEADEGTGDLWDEDDYICGRGDPKRRPIFNRPHYDWLMVAATGSKSHFLDGHYGGRRGFKPDRVFESAQPTVRVFAKWGYAEECPDVIKKACIVEVGRWFKRAQSSWADAVGDGGMGEFRFVKKLDPLTIAILDNAGMVRRGV